MRSLAMIFAYKIKPTMQEKMQKKKGRKKEREKESKKNTVANSGHLVSKSPFFFHVF